MSIFKEPFHKVIVKPNKPLIIENCYNGQIQSELKSPKRKT
jgi:hypothetical protein